MKDLLENMIASANRNQVSFYTFDIRRLKTYEPIGNPNNAVDSSGNVANVDLENVVALGRPGSIKPSSTSPRLRRPLVVSSSPTPTTFGCPCGA